MTKAVPTGEAHLSEALRAGEALLCLRPMTPAESEEGGVRALSEDDGAWQDGEAQETQALGRNVSSHSRPSV